MCVLGVSEQWRERPEEVYFISDSTPYNNVHCSCFWEFCYFNGTVQGSCYCYFLCVCSSVSEDSNANPQMMDSEVSVLLHCAAWKGLLESEVQVELSER